MYLHILKNLGTNTKGVHSSWELLKSFRTDHKPMLCVARIICGNRWYSQCDSLPTVNILLWNRCQSVKGKISSYKVQNLQKNLNMEVLTQ